jgi:hypothetical protein
VDTLECRDISDERAVTNRQCVDTMECRHISDRAVNNRQCVDTSYGVQTHQ